MKSIHDLLGEARLPSHSSLGGFLVSFSGAIFRREFLPEASVRDFGLGSDQNDVPLNQDYLGWLDLLDAVAMCDGTSFTVAELGAGCGIWMLNAASLVRARHPAKAIRLIGTEAEPSHFEFLLQAVRDNGFNPDDHRLVMAALGSHTGLVWFYIGEASEWYGQSVVPSEHVQSMLSKNGLPTSYVPSKEGEILETSLVYPNRRNVCRKAISVRMMSLDDLIGDVDGVDFLHADLQGAELDVIDASRDLLDAKVRIAHIGTHSTEIEEGLRSTFGSLGWQKRWDFPRKSHSDTPFGTLTFGDGVQSWLNPRLS